MIRLLTVCSTGGLILAAAAAAAGVAAYMNLKDQKNEDRSLEIESQYFSVVDEEEENYLDLDDEIEGSHSQEGDELYEKVDALLKGSQTDRERALDILKKKYPHMDTESNFLWRFAKAHGLLARIEKERDKKLDQIREGLKYAEEAIKRDEKNPEAHKSFALLVGMKGELSPANKEKVAAANTFKEHIDRAIKLNPRDPHLHHLSGVFKYRIASLPLIKRKGARLLYGDNFNFGYSDAIKDFLTAERLNDSYKQNKFYLSKCYLEIDSKEKGMAYLKRAKELPSHTPEDDECDFEIEELIWKYDVK